MDYYYSLLNSYELLKRRKFKLSLREEEGGGDDKARQEAIKAAQAAFGTAIEINADERKNKASGSELIFVKSGPNLDKVSAIGGPFSSRSMKGVQSLDELDDRSYNLVIGYFMEEPAESPAVTGEDEGDETTEQEEVISPEVQAITDTLAKIDQAEEDKAAVNDEDPDEDVEEDDAVAARREEEEAAILAEEAEKLRLLPGLTELITEFDADTISQTLEGTNAFLDLGLKLSQDPGGAQTGKYTQEITQIITKYDITLDQYGCIRFRGVGVGVCNEEDGGMFPAKLQEFVPLVQEAQEQDREEKGIGSEARLIVQEDLEDPAIEAARGVAIENVDAYATMLSDCIKTTEEKMADCADQFGPEVLDAWKRHNELEDRRDKIRNDKTLTADEMAEQLEALEKVISREKGGHGEDIDSLLRSLAVGILAQESAILTGAEEVKAYHTIRFLEDRLVAEGADPEAAKAFLKEAAGMTEDGKIALDENGVPVNGDRIKAILALSLGNRLFAKAIRRGINPTKTVGAGQGQRGASNVIGKKEDLLDIYCPNDPQYKDRKDLKKDLRENVKGLLSKEQREHYSKKCGKGKADEGRLDKWIDDRLIQTIDPADFGVKCEGGGEAFGISREPKSHAENADGQVQDSTLGSMGPTKVEGVFEYLCNGSTKGISTKHGEDKHIDNFIKDMEECGKGKGAATKKGACAFYQTIEAGITTSLATLKMGQTVKGSAVHPGLATIQGWADHTSLRKGGELTAKGKERKEAATRALLGQPAVPPATQESDIAELNSIRRDIRAAGLRNALTNSPDRDSHGVLSGGARDFAITMYSILASAHGEVINEKRNYSSNTHQVGLRNAEVRANQATAVFKHGAGSMISVEDSNGNQRAKIVSTITGEAAAYKIDTGTSKELYHQISDEDTPEEIRRNIKLGKVKNKHGKWVKRRKGQKEDMFVQFLQGQQALLEKLLNQST